MALKVVLMLFLAMLLFTENNVAIIGDYETCLAKCYSTCSDPLCVAGCALGCSWQSVDPENHVCNVGCTFGHCYKFLIQYENNAAIIGDYETCREKCASSCRDPLCLTICLAGCPFDTTNEVETRNHVCNVGCSIGHCYKFLIQYDNDKFGSCMTSCGENYCIGNTALKKT